MNLIEQVKRIIAGVSDDTLRAELVIEAVKSGVGKMGGRPRKPVIAGAEPVSENQEPVTPEPKPVIENRKPVSVETANRPTCARGEDLSDPDQIPDLEYVPSGVDGGVGEGEPTIPKRQASRAKVTSADFAAWFEAYPRKVGIRDAFKAWQQTAAERPPVPLMLEALVWQRRTRDWTKDGGAFIPHPATYLRRGSWADLPLGKVGAPPAAPAVPRANPAPFTPPTSRGWGNGS